MERKLGIRFKPPLTPEKLDRITQDAKAKIHSQEDYFAFVLDNWDDVMRCMSSNSHRRVMRVAKPLMKMAIGRK